MFAEIRHHIPSLSAWMESYYACQPFLLLGTDSIRSCVGVQQGDPLGPLGFTLTLHPLIEKIRAEVPGLFLNAWYLDDGTRYSRVVLVSEVPHYIPQLLFWPPAQLLNPLWSGYLATLLALHPTPALLCLLLLLPQPILTGCPWTISMFPCISALSLSLSMRLLSSDSSHLPLPSALAPWPSPPVCPMLGTGSAWCRQLPWASTSKTENSDAACGIGLGLLSSAT